MSSAPNNTNYIPPPANNGYAYPPPQNMGYPPPPPGMMYVPQPTMMQPQSQPTQQPFGGYINPNMGYNNVYPSVPPSEMKLPGMTPQQAAYLSNLQKAREMVTYKDGGFLGGYKFNPNNLKFASQNPREQVFVLLRAHPFTNLGWIFFTVLWGVMPFLLAVLARLVGFNISSVPIIGAINAFTWAKFGTLALMAYYSLLMTYVFGHLLDWYYNLYLITNERIIDFNFKTLISYDIVEARLESIEDVREKSVGFLPGLFGYGDIIVQTAAAHGNFDFISVPQPSRVRDVISDLSKLAREIYRSENYYRGER